MADTTFISGTTIASTWLNDVNKVTYGSMASWRFAWMAASNGKKVTTGVADAPTRTNNTQAINQHIQDLGDAGGGMLILPSGRIEVDGALNGYESDPVGATVVQVNVRGAAIDATTIYPYHNTYVLNLKGTGTNNRIIATWSDFTIDGTAATGTDQIGAVIGWNMRSLPLLARIKMRLVPHYGLDFEDLNWNVGFDDIELDQCAKLHSNSAGVYLNPAVNSGNFNAITFRRCQIEGGGSAGSTAGAFNMAPSSIGNHGLYLTDCIFEGNLGTDEIYIANFSDVQITNLYGERVSGGVHPTSGAVYMELSNVKGQIQGGYITSEDATNKYGLRIAGGSDVIVNGVGFGAWSLATIYNLGSKVTTIRNFDATYLDDSAAQWYGDYAPRMSAHKNGTNQTGVASNSYTKVTFGTERYDLTNAFASSTYAPKTIGTYQIDAQVTWASGVGATGDQLLIAVYVNGAVYKEMQYYAYSTGTQKTHISAQVDINAVTDTIEIYARQTNGASATRDIVGNASDTWFMASLIGRTA